MLDRVARLTWRRPKLVLGLVGAFIVISVIFGRGVEEHLKAAGFTDSSSESERVTALLRDELGYDANPGIFAVLQDPGGEELDLTDPELRREVARLTAVLRGVEFVGYAQNPLGPIDRADEEIRKAQDREIDRAKRRAKRAARDAAAQAAALGLPPPDLPKPDLPSDRELDRKREQRLDKVARELRRESPIIADDGLSLVISGHLTTQDIEEDGGVAAAEAGERLTSETLDFGLGGFAPTFDETENQVREDLTKAELIAFPVLALLLLLVFRGVVAAGIPLLIGGASILGTFLMLRVMSEFTDTSLFALNIATGLSLGLAVDYALLIVSRYREESEKHGYTEQAHMRTVATAGRTVMFSGMTVAVAMAALVVFPQRFLYSIAVAGASVGILASLISVLTVPAMLSLLGPRINSLAIRKGPAVSDESDGWYKLAWWVMKRPVAVALGSTALLLAAALPLIGAVLTGPSAEVVPPGQPSYAANTYVENHYDRDISEAITVTVKGRASGKELDELRSEFKAIEGIDSASEFERASPYVAYANLAPNDKALNDGPQQAVREIRGLEPPGSAELLVSGNTARFIDQKESLIEHTPLVLAIVGLTTLFLLFMLTGSVILPFKTLLMNALTLGAALGLLVLSFQHGLLNGLLDYTGPKAIEVTSLVFVFAVTFGLATDYAVLVMARIKEEHDKGVSNEEAVATGIGHTGRVITAAALMIAVVFLAFAVSEVFFMKQIAIAQAAGVLIDATIVRALLVPSLMRLLGEWNWWAPAPLARFQARYGFKE